MNLHNEIMNIPVRQLQEMAAVTGATNQILTYRTGHRDARHAAAELSLRYAALIEELLDALEARNADDYVDRIRAEYSL